MAKQYLDKDGVQQVWNAAKSKFMPSSGTATRPTYNGNNLALYSDIPSTAKNLYTHLFYFLCNNMFINGQIVLTRSTSFSKNEFLNFLKSTPDVGVVVTGVVYKTDCMVASALYYSATRGMNISGSRITGTPVYYGDFNIEDLLESSEFADTIRQIS